MRALNGPTFYDCDHCEAHPYMKQMLGHDGPPSGYWRENLLTKQKLAKCPRMVEREAVGTAAAAEVRDARELRALFGRGMLPEAGGVLDQPALLLDLLELHEAADRAVQAKAEQLAADNAAASREEA